MTLKPQSEVKLKPEIVNSENLVVPENRKNLAVNGGLKNRVMIFHPPAPYQHAQLFAKRTLPFYTAHASRK